MLRSIDPGSLTHPIRFRDAALDEAFRRDGYLKVPFLDEAGLAALAGLWRTYGPDDVTGIWSNVHALPIEANRVIDDTITETFRAPAERLFSDGYLAGASFLVKGTGPESASTPHQDWNNVDERDAESLSIWCPLVDVDRANGALVVIPGSHRLRPSLRSIDSPSIYLDFTDELEPHLEVIEARAGEAVLYAHNLFHGSKPNQTTATRVSAVSGVLPTAARHIHYRRIAAERFEVLEVDRRFYMEGIPTLASGVVPPTARPAETITFEDHELAVHEVLAGSTDHHGELAP